MYQLNINTKQIKQFTDRLGPDSSPVVSADGKMIAYLGFDDKKQGYQVTRLYTYSLSTKKSMEISGDLDLSIYGINWSKDGKGIYCMYDENGNTKIGYSTLAGKIIEQADNVGGTSMGRPYNSGSYSISNDGSIAFTLSTPDHPSDLAVTGSNSGLSRLTNLNEDIFKFKKH